MDPPRTFRRVPLLPHQMLDRVTSQRDLFVLAHVGVPRVDASAWTVSVTGLVREPATFTLDQIRRLPKIEVESFHQCAGYPSNPKIATRRVGNVVWGGADLKALLDTLGVSPRARFLWSYGVDHGDYEGIRSGPYLKDCPLERVAQGGVLLAYEINGEPLDAEHGFPLRLVSPASTAPTRSNGCRGCISPTRARMALSPPSSITTQSTAARVRSGRSRRSR